MKFVLALIPFVLICIISYITAAIFKLSIVPTYTLLFVTKVIIYQCGPFLLTPINPLELLLFIIILFLLSRISLESEVRLIFSYSIYLFFLCNLVNWFSMEFKSFIFLLVWLSKFYSEITIFSTKRVNLLSSHGKFETYERSFLSLSILEKGNLVSFYIYTTILFWFLSSSSDSSSFSIKLL